MCWKVVRSKTVVSSHSISSVASSRNVSTCPFTATQFRPEPMRVHARDRL